MDIESKIALIRKFRDKLTTYRNSPSTELRSEINQMITSVRREVVEAGCFKTITISPPPAVGGMIMQNIDLFDLIFDAPYGRSTNSVLTDCLDQTIGVLTDMAANPRTEANVLSEHDGSFERGYVFIAMPMAGDKPEYDDVLDAIKLAAKECGLNAERVDDVQSNERITDRLLESIRRAEFVIVDLTDYRPNVFYEAGYAQGIGKTPIYVAKEGTKLEFDLKDYPVIFFSSMRSLREGLEARLRGLDKMRVAARQPAAVAPAPKPRRS